MLDKHHAYHWKTVPGNLGTPVGCADLICCVYGWFLAAEAKRPVKPEPLKPAQRVFLHKIADAGGIAVVFDDPAQLADLCDRLKRLNSKLRVDEHGSIDFPPTDLRTERLIPLVR